eukprot:124088-Chlamydomonas_euryale.AAC.7
MTPCRPTTRCAPRQALIGVVAMRTSGPGDVGKAMSQTQRVKADLMDLKEWRSGSSDGAHCVLLRPL